MLIRIGNKICIATLYGNEVLTLTNSLEWYTWMKTVRDFADNSIKIMMKAMESFWIWTLYNPLEITEVFHVYQARYRDALRSGFEITIKVKDEEFEDEIEIIVYERKPLQKRTINKELSGISSYFYFTEESRLIDDHRFVNYLYEKHKSASSMLAGVQIKKSTLALEAFGKKVKYLPPYKITKNKENTKYFPLELFDDLLSIAKPRDRLIYLLCGACSARIGQTLNLTLYDIDYEKMEVWLLDPKSDTVDMYGNKRRLWLKEEYNIDTDNSNAHNTPDLQFKYPIPRHHEPLYWINDKYKKLFFETLHEYTNSKEYISEYARFPRHPFFFTTRTGKRVHARDTLSRFKSNLRKLSQKHPKFTDLNRYGLHSLRHLFGHYMGEVYARYGDDVLIQITMDAMGHTSLSSTMVYFKISTNTKRAILKKFADELYEIKEKENAEEIKK